MAYEVLMHIRCHTNLSMFQKGKRNYPHVSEAKRSFYLFLRGDTAFQKANEALQMPNETFSCSYEMLLHIRCHTF